MKSDILRFSDNSRPKGLETLTSEQAQQWTEIWAVVIEQYTGTLAAVKHYEARKMDTFYVSYKDKLQRNVDAFTFFQFLHSMLEVLAVSVSKNENDKKFKEDKNNLFQAVINHILECFQKTDYHSTVTAHDSRKANITLEVLRTLKAAILDIEENTPESKRGDLFFAAKKKYLLLLSLRERNRNEREKNELSAQILKMAQQILQHGAADPKKITAAAYKAKCVAFLRSTAYYVSHTATTQASQMTVHFFEDRKKTTV